MLLAKVDPNVWATPQEDNILVWHYVLKGLDGSAYEGGYYYGKLKFPSQYPFKPPSIMICTPNERFATNTRLCLTMSDFHPESWNPLWSVSTILTGLHNFMHEDSTTVGSIQTSISNKRNYASETMVFNLKNKHFVNLFGDLIQQINTEKEEIQEQLESFTRLFPAEPPVLSKLKAFSEHLPPHSEARIDVSEMKFSQNSINVKAETDQFEQATSIVQGLKKYPLFAQAQKSDEKNVAKGVRFNIVIPLTQNKEEEN